MESSFKPLLRQQNTQCSYNVTLRCFHVTVVNVEKQYMLNILNVSLYFLLPSMQSACAVLYFHLRLDSLYCIFFNYFTNRIVIEKRN